MFSHVVIFWTDPTKPNAADELIAGGEKYLRHVPGVVNFNMGRMVPSTRPVVEQSYQVALSMQFESQEAEAAYQVHPLHEQFLENHFKPYCTRVVVYDFE